MFRQQKCRMISLQRAQRRRTESRRTRDVDREAELTVPTGVGSSDVLGDWLIFANNHNSVLSDGCVEKLRVFNQ